MSSCTGKRCHCGNTYTMNPLFHILVVDDEPAIGDLIETYLSQEGYRVSTAEGGEAMRRILEAESVDLVILDLVLPGEDGFSLTRYLREHSDVAIIILTGKGETVDRIIGLEIGADDYLAKPFELREFLARVRSVLRRATPKPRRGSVGDRVRIEADPQPRADQGRARYRLYLRALGGASLVVSQRNNVIMMDTPQIPSPWVI